MTDRERAIAFVDDLDERIVDLVERHAWGAALTTPSLPKIYDANFLQLERWQGALADLTPEVDRVLGAVGCTHRKVSTWDEKLGVRLAAEADDAEWPVVERHLLMTLARPRDREPDAAIEVADLDVTTFAGLVAATVREEPYGDDPDVVEGLLELDRRIGRELDVRHFGAIVDGEPVSRASLFLSGAIAQVEDVATLTRHRGRGLARAVVSHAIDEAHRAGADLVIIIADLDDWPWKLYSKLGFDRIALAHDISRPAPGPLADAGPLATI